MARIHHGLLAAVVLAVAVAAPALAASKVFKANLRGADEVPAHDTKATGHATLTVNSDQTSIDYKVTLGNIDNVTGIHIHLGALGENGDVVATLFGPAAAGGGRANGMVAHGTLTASSLQGPLAGKTIADLVAAMQEGRAYVNVHTDDGSSTTSDRPGDFANGEIRGQIR